MPWLGALSTASRLAAVVLRYVVVKYQFKERHPVPLYFSGIVFEEVKIERKSAIQIAKTWAASSSCEKSSAT